MKIESLCLSIFKHAWNFIQKKLEKSQEFSSPGLRAVRRRKAVVAQTARGFAEDVLGQPPAFQRLLLIRI